MVNDMNTDDLRRLAERVLAPGAATGLFLTPHIAQAILALLDERDRLERSREKWRDSFFTVESRYRGRVAALEDDQIAQRADRRRLEDKVAALEAERDRTRDSLHAVFGEKERLEDRVAVLKEGLDAALSLIQREARAEGHRSWQFVLAKATEARALLAAAPSAPRCDRIVNNGMGEPTECGRTLPCEMHDPAAPSEPQRYGFSDYRGVPAAPITPIPNEDEFTRGYRLGNRDGIEFQKEQQSGAAPPCPDPLAHEHEPWEEKWDSDKARQETRRESE